MKKSANFYSRNFLLSQLKSKKNDKLISEAVKIIYQKKGSIQIKELNKILAISQSPFEKRFRALVGTSPKKFASIVRFNAVLNSLGTTKTLTEISYENNFFDQAHFINDFKKYTGDTPESLKHTL
ncbi:helix-turn-helix domain-containing protein [Spirosoma daeguense]